jgi:hypothetical protein
MTVPRQPAHPGEVLCREFWMLGCSMAASSRRSDKVVVAELKIVLEEE